MAFLDNDSFQVIRPRVIETEYGRFRGYVDIQIHQPDALLNSKVRYCPTTCVSRDQAERQALALARQLGRAARATGASAWLLNGSLSDARAGRGELDGVPDRLLRRNTANAKSARKPLRMAA